jgi:hypothetical protein
MIRLLRWNLRKQRNFIHALQGRDSIACNQKE